MTRASFVYLAKCDGEYKIGVSDTPERRMKELSHEYGITFTLVHSFYTPYPFRWEAYFHWLHEDNCTGGEFFVLCSSTVQRICNLPSQVDFKPTDHTKRYETMYPYRYDKYLKAMGS